ncbi:DNA-binding Lrp family transcriptional regulator [Bradyrhizobium sp. AZCC 1610]
MNPRPPVSERELKALRALAQVFEYDGNHLSFRGIAQRSGLDLRHVRRSVRALARKGFALYGKGLWDEEGPRGAGYRATHDGMCLLQYLGETE